MRNTLYSTFLYLDALPPPHGLRLVFLKKYFLLMLARKRSTPQCCHLFNGNAFYTYSCCHTWTSSKTVLRAATRPVLMLPLFTNIHCFFLAEGMLTFRRFQRSVSLKFNITVSQLWFPDFLRFYKKFSMPRLQRMWYLNHLKGHSKVNLLTFLTESWSSSLRNFYDAFAEL